MKKIFLLLLVLVISVSFQNGNTKQCPLTGNTKNKKYQQLNVLKNRMPTPQNIDTSVTLQKILAPGNDTNRFKTSQYVTVTGFLFKYKYGGPESCNCGDNSKSIEDFHLEIVQNLDGFVDGKDVMICEITWRGRLGDSTLTEQYVRTLVGKKVKVSGYMFYDAEHWENAENTNSTGTNIWRNTCWEIHPVVSIKQIL